MEKKVGALQAELPGLKGKLDRALSKIPALYLFVEDRRGWVNWDKRIYLSLIRRGDVIADVGANVGAHAAMFANLVGASGEVFAFEPLPANLGALGRTLDARTDFANVTIIAAAVGNPDSAGEQVTMNVPGDDLTQASLAVQSGGSWASGTNVRQISCALTSLDHEAEARRITRLDFVKIDVEGAELEAVKGGATTLRKLKPVLYCEVYEKWTDAFGYSPADLFAAVRSLGYTEARIIREGEVTRRALDSPIAAGIFDISCNVLFSAPGHSGRLAAFDKRYGRSWR